MKQYVVSSHKNVVFLVIDDLVLIFLESISRKLLWPCDCIYSQSKDKRRNHLYGFMHLLPFFYGGPYRYPICFCKMEGFIFASNLMSRARMCPKVGIGNGSV